MKNKLKGFAYFCIKNNIMVSGVAFVFFIALFIAIKVLHKDIELIDFTIFFAIFMAMILELLANAIAKIIQKRIEDFVKLEANYEKLVRKYETNGNFISYTNSNCLLKNQKKGEKVLKKEGREIKTNENGAHKFVFPVITECYLDDKTITVTDSLTQYQLPEDVKENFDELFSAHKNSNIYNQLNIRVDKWECQNNIFMMETSRTTYYDSLVTNRSMDYEWHNGLTNRDKYAYGPFVPDLSQSPLSNHLGFNGFVISKDGYIPFVKRNDIVSIGKKTYGNSIGASLKTKYCLDIESKLFTLKGLEEGIKREIKDELKIDSNNIKHFCVEKNMIAAYRDMMEGGKPQLLFWAESTLDKDEITANFIEQIKKKKHNKRRKWDKEYKELEDGKKLLWIKLEELEKLYITPEMFVYDGKVYPTTPSASAAIVMFINYRRRD